jgi:C4-dicarboxylate transporter, DctQ subunit
MLDRFFENLEKVVGVINKVFVFFASLMMCGLVAIVCADIFMRYFLRSPFIWATELTEIFLLQITFLGAAWVLREDGHVVIDVILVKVTEKTKRILNFISYILIAVVGGILIYYGFATTYSHYVRKVFNPTAIETQIWMIIIIIPIGSIPLFLEVFIKVWKMLRR